MLVALFRFNVCCAFVSLVCLFGFVLVIVVICWIMVACFAAGLLIGDLRCVYCLRMECGLDGVWLCLVGLLGWFLHVHFLLCGLFCC